MSDKRALDDAGNAGAIVKRQKTGREIIIGSVTKEVRLSQALMILHVHGGT